MSCARAFGHLAVVSTIILMAGCAAHPAYISATDFPYVRDGQPSSIPPDAGEPLCGFDVTSLSFAGDERQQAQCLLRHVLPGGVADTGIDLPHALAERVGWPVLISRSQMRAYLAAHGISEADLGGPLDEPVSQTEAGVPARYFVIHDTSSPNLLGAPFPDDVNDAAWPGNNLTQWQKGDGSVAHVFINRAGQSVTAIDFSRGWRATKLESQVVGQASRGRFLHIENEQPRRSSPTQSPGNDAIAPTPGFTDAQLHRLALVYIAASVRAGIWLIPAQHALIDSGIPGGHDDPQNFDLGKWAASVDETAAAIAGEHEETPP